MQRREMFECNVNNVGKCYENKKLLKWGRN